MDIGSIFLILALLILVALFVSRPFFERQPPVNQLSDSQDHQISSLLAERDRVLNALQELDFDYALGKIPEEDYPAQRVRLLQYGADILRKLDEQQAVAPGGAPMPAPLSAEARMEAAVAARRADAGRAGITPRPSSNGGKVVSAAVAAPDDDLEVLLANRRRARLDESAGFCVKCGNAIQRSDKFCPKCGVRLA